MDTSLKLADKQHHVPHLALAVLIPVVLAQQTVGALCFPIAKYGLTIIEPFTYAFFRYLLASAALLLIVRARPQGVAIKRPDIWRILLLGLLIIPGNQTLYLWGQSLTAAGHGSIMFATTPIWVFVLSATYLREKVIWRRMLGLATALCGAFVIVLAGAVQVGLEYLLGDVIILLSVWCWALYTILGKPLAEKYGAIRITAYAMSAGTLMYAPFGLYRAIRFEYAQTNLGAWLTIVYMAIAMSVVGYTIWYWLLKHMQASRLAVFSNVQPVIATVVAYFALGEVPGTAFFIGAAVVLTGVIITEV